METTISHTTTINGINITNPTAIRKAVDNLRARGVSISLVENATPRMYYSHQEAEVGSCEFVLRLPDAEYDVGLKKQADGTYAPVFDEWANSVGRQVGGQCAIPKTAEEKSMWAIGSFSQEYAKEAAISAAQAQGYSVQSATTDADGNVNLVFAGY